jgi:hypothetical protein
MASWSAINVNTAINGKEIASTERIFMRRFYHPRFPIFGGMIRPFAMVG